MDLSSQKRALLAAGDIRGLIGLNHGVYGDAQMMARGYNATADLMRTTADGRDLNELYTELQQATDLKNQQQQNFLSLFTTPTNSAVTSVLQTVGGSSDIFEDASEYGVPKGTRIKHDVLDLGATFKWYDAAWKATWRYLADATDAEIAANAAAILAADEEKVFTEVMATVFRHTNRQVLDARTNSQYTVFSFANGTDSWTPPSYAGQSFSNTHTHFRTSGAAAIVSGDLDEIVDDFKSHGLNQENGTQIVIFVNATEGNTVMGFRTATGARSDFVPASGSRFFATDGDLVGDPVPASFAGFPVKGSYDEALIIESARIPAGYVVGLASGGALANTNPIMFRQHPKFPGLTLIRGNQGDYPLVDSYWTHGFGTGVRHRLAGLVMQISTSPTYAPPALYPA